MSTHPLAVARASYAPARSSELPASDEIRLVGVTKSFGRDQAIYGEGDAAGLVYKVISGGVRTFRVLADGRRQIWDFYLPGDVFGVELDAERRSGAEAICETVLLVARRSALAEDPAQGQRLWRHALRQLRRSQDHALTLGRRSASERVASFLLDLAQRLGSGDELELPMSRQDMADYLGLTIETVSRTVTQMQGGGLICLTGCRHVRLTRPDALAELCE